MDTSKLVNITSLVGLTIKLERVKNKWSQEELAFKFYWSDRAGDECSECRNGGKDCVGIWYDIF